MVLVNFDGNRPVGGFLAIDPQTIPQEIHESYMEYGTHDTGILFEFYGNAKEDNFLGHRTVSVPLLRGITLGGIFGGSGIFRFGSMRRTTFLIFVGGIFNVAQSRKPFNFSMAENSAT